MPVGMQEARRESKSKSKSKSNKLGVNGYRKKMGSNI
jgi:hypothetical protein